MAKVNRKHARQLTKALKKSSLDKAQHQQAWNIFHETGQDAALAFAKSIEDQQPKVELKEPVPYQIWGNEFIDEQSITQMDYAVRLPISVAGALMPDAHLGYGLPIGGVLATDNAVIPYAVGVDIACRMKMTVFDLGEQALKRYPDLLKKTLLRETRFGIGAAFEKNNLSDHEVLDDSNWQATPLLRNLYDKAVVQLGTSGGGNHFVEWGLFTIGDADNPLGIAEPGTYLALLSHSGSRGMGARIADHYSKLARNIHPGLPGTVKYLAWFDMDTEAGQEYWIAMQLAGAFASANHAVIHKRIAKATGFKPLAMVENHHNFAWKEIVQGQETIVHRKGATPAGANVLGIIPGSMGDPGFVVRGRGNDAALNSTSHGAGRMMSRRQAKKSITHKQQHNYLKERGVELLGGGLDESPQAYKSIHDVMGAQTDLVEIIGRFDPKIVRMADD